MPLKQKLELFLFRLSLLAGGTVLLFSILNGYHFLIIMLRTVLSFLFIYSLGKGLIELWQRILPPPRKENRYRPRVDVILGDVNSNEINPEDGKEEYRADVANTYSRVVPGQVNIDMKNELEDAENKAEIVRRMGWGEEVSD